VANILLTWELGSGLGHIAELQPVAAGLAQQGHVVVAALRNLSSASKSLRGVQVRLLPAPYAAVVNRGDAGPIATHPELLQNTGFGDVDELQSLYSAWRTIYSYVQPDAIVANFSPIALLAARGTPAKVVVLGTGFECPGLSSPYPNWRPELDADLKRYLKIEADVLANANLVLKKHGEPPMSALADLYRDVDETLLLTYPELDPFGQRPGANYLGVWPDPPGIKPKWPQCAGPRVFAYLRPLLGVQNVLAMLRDKGAATILRIPHVPESLQREFDAPNLHWEHEFLDMEATLRQCDLGICHASHVMSASMLHAGKPILMFPPFLEQGLTAMKIASRHAGVFSSMEDPAHFTNAFGALLTDLTYRASAEEFSRKYPSERRKQRVEEAVERIARLLP
jgi:UDP:flavonoid glycosyltransferase YjiC (YdhE family)